MKQSTLRLLKLSFVFVSLIYVCGSVCGFEIAHADGARKKPQTRGAYRAELDALIKSNTVPCKTQVDCTALPVGSKACGGPVEYVIISTGTQAKIQTAMTDLTKTINELDAAANDGGIGTCEAAVKPEVACHSGSCVRGPDKR